MNLSFGGLCAAIARLGDSTTVGTLVRLRINGEEFNIKEISIRAKVAWPEPQQTEPVLIIEGEKMG